MNIIIPLAGKGERFKKEGYEKPKCMIKIYEKTMLEYVIDHIEFEIKEEERSKYHFFIFYREDLDKENFIEYYQNKYENIYFVRIPETKGASETLLLGIEHLKKHQIKMAEKTLIIDCDTFYTENIIKIFENHQENMVFYTKKRDEKPIYSYIKMEEGSNRIEEIMEKKKISENANTGAYGFKDIKELKENCKYIIENQITFQNEPYTSCVIDRMIREGHIFEGYELNGDKVFVVGTPRELKEYMERSYGFLFDLDGTIVITDEIYYKVWSKILKEFNVTLTKSMYNDFIQGNSDQNIIENIFRIPLRLKEFSELKDKIFIEESRKGEKIKIKKGFYEFIKSIYEGGHKICIISNGNRRIIEYILKEIGIEKYIDFYIGSEDCLGRTKPNSYPYLSGIRRYEINPKKCFIFEDSKSGILSALSVSPRLVVGIETIYNKDTLKNIGVNFSIENYKDIKIKELIEYKMDSIYDIKKMIEGAFFEGEEKIEIDDNNLKGGFIASVISFKKGEMNYVLKYENEQTNNLSLMAKNLQLYQREYYFYEKIAPFIRSTIKIPEYINTIYDNELKAKGIILENLFNNKRLKINLDLNREKIDVSLKIIDRMSKMHSIFWNKNLSKMFPELPNSRSKIFNPFFKEFMEEKYPLFCEKWRNILTENQMRIMDDIYKNFDDIQKNLSIGNLTFIHGDIKSPNLFYDESRENEPYFLDWQHCAIGKGTQDLIFFLIESFDIKNLKIYYQLFKYYYYQKLRENKIENYSWEEYEKDLKNSLNYVPFFTAIWFGSLSYDELIDKNWPYFFIQKYMYVLENVV